MQPSSSTPSTPCSKHAPVASNVQLAGFCTPAGTSALPPSAPSHRGCSLGPFLFRPSPALLVQSFCWVAALRSFGDFGPSAFATARFLCRLGLLSQRQMMILWKLVFTVFGFLPFLFFRTLFAPAVPFRLTLRLTFLRNRWSLNLKLCPAHLN